jgi:flavodoxin
VGLNSISATPHLGVARLSISPYRYRTHCYRGMMHPLVVYYSRTGNTHRVAHTIASTLESPTVERIRPVTRRRYSNWLLRSCVPGSRVPIQPIETDLSSRTAVFLGTPKWTLSCPPVTEYVERADFEGTKIGVFMTYGGFDEERYLRQLVDRLEAQGGTVVATLRVQRDAIDTAECSQRTAGFCRAVLEE